MTAAAHDKGICEELICGHVAVPVAVKVPPEDVDCLRIHDGIHLLAVYIAHISDFIVHILLRKIHVEERRLVVDIVF